MTARLIDGNTIASELSAKTATRASALSLKGASPSLAAVLVGEDASARSYAKSQALKAQALGVAYQLVELPGSSRQAEIEAAVRQLNLDASVSGIILQMPLPAGIDAFSLQQRIAPDKDVEGVSATNYGLLAMGREALIPCTAAAAMACLRSVVPDLAGKNAVLIGRSTIVGKPLGMLLLAAHATVTQCHTRTKNLLDHTRRGEILMVAAGSAGLIGKEHVSPGAIVVDVGTHRVKNDADGKMRTVGDVRFEEVASIAGAITPVPGGVGPVTVAMLMSNVVDACERQHRA